MAKYILSNKAVEDLANIWKYTFEEWSELQADKYYRGLLATCQRIANKPALGKSYHEVLPDLFGLKSNRHIIFYRKLSEDLIEITRILHGRMDIEIRIKE